MNQQKKNKLAFLLLTAIFMVTMVMTPAGRAMAEQSGIIIMR